MISDIKYESSDNEGNRYLIKAKVAHLYLERTIRLN